MRRIFMLGLIAVATTTTTSGCFLNMYSSDPIRRQRQLVNQSLDLKLLEDDMERFWMIDRPSNLGYKRMHGFGMEAARPIP